VAIILQHNTIAEINVISDFNEILSVARQTELNVSIPRQLVPRVSLQCLKFTADIRVGRHLSRKDIIQLSANILFASCHIFRMLLLQEL